MIVSFRDLASNSLTGEIPTQLGSLSNLYSLYDIFIFSSIYLVIDYFRDLSLNRLTGEIPTELGSLLNLYDLYDTSVFSPIFFDNCLF